MDDRTKKAFDFAADSIKQLLTLSTAIIALTITFSKDLVGTVPKEDKLILTLAWVGFFLSILFGIGALLALTGTLEPRKIEKNVEEKQNPQVPASIRGGNVTVLAGLQILTFLAALILTIVFGAKSI